MITRRHFAIGTGLGILGGVLAAPRRAAAASEPFGDLRSTFARIEAGLKGRLGVSVLDVETGRRAGHRGGERFPLCSTFKMLAGAAVLKRVDQGQENLNRRIRYEAGAIMPHSPATKGRVGSGGMTLGELCDAAITLSDNTAGNLLLKSLGGPEGLTAFVRSLGDAVTRLDRWETELNEARSGDPRDTTTPDAMTADLDALVLGDALTSRSREQLAAWLVANKTGDKRIRAGLPNGWRVGDKTGTGEQGTANDVAVVWPPGRKPLIVSVYVTETKASLDERSAVIAKVARAVAGAVNS